MENNYHNQQAISVTKSALPNATTVLVLGIISIILCSFIGLVLGIIAMVLSKKDLKLYNNNSEAYTLESYNNLKSGRTCAIIGVVLSSIVSAFTIIYLIIIFGFIGFAALSGIN